MSDDAGIKTIEVIQRDGQTWYRPVALLPGATQAEVGDDHLQPGNATLEAHQRWPAAQRVKHADLLAELVRRRDQRPQ